MKHFLKIFRCKFYGFILYKNKSWTNLVKLFHTFSDQTDTTATMMHSQSLSSHASLTGTPTHQFNANSPVLNMGQEELIKWLRNIKLTEWVQYLFIKTAKPERCNCMEKLVIRLISTLTQLLSNSTYVSKSCLSGFLK